MADKLLMELLESGKDIRKRMARLEEEFILARNSGEDARSLMARNILEHGREVDVWILKIIEALATEAAQ